MYKRQVPTLDEAVDGGAVLPPVELQSSPTVQTLDEAVDSGAVLPPVELQSSVTVPTLDADLSELSVYDLLSMLKDSRLPDDAVICITKQTLIQILNSGTAYL